VAPIPSVRKRVGDAAPATNTTPVEWAAPFGSALRIPATCISPAPNNDVGRAFVAPLTDLFRASRIRASPRRTIPADYRAGLRAHVNGLRASEMLGERFGIARSGRHRRHGLHQQDDGAGYGSVVQRSAHSTATETSTRRSSQGVIPQTYTARAASSIAASEECDEPQGNRSSRRVSGVARDSPSTGGIGRHHPCPSRPDDAAHPQLAGARAAERRCPRTSRRRPP